MSSITWTAEQQAAINHRRGPLRIIAGAGSGKTATMTEHIARLIRTGVATPEQIVALTFTNAAASELSERIQQTLGDSRIDVWSGTYHAFGGQIVSDGARVLNLPSEPRLLSQVEVWLTVRKILQDGIEIEQLDMANFGGAINNLVAFISRSKDELVMPDAISEYIHTIPKDDAEHAAEMRDYLRVYTAYRDRCLERGAVDYGDQIQLAVHALDNDAGLLAEYRDRYRFFVVDEYQDTNFAQAELVRRLATPGYDLRVVGDPQQSIYRFRGAAVDNIRRFSDEIPGTTDVKLSTNFRSHQAILDVANRLVIDTDMAATLTAHNGASGARPVIAHASAWSDETQWIAETLASHRDAGTTSMAVLVRKRKLPPALARTLERRGIPYQILGGEGIFDLPAVKDALATIRVLSNPADITSAVRVLTSPRCGLNDHTVFALRDHLRSANYLTSLREIVANPPPSIDPAVVEAASSFCDDLGSLVRTAKSQPVDVLTRQVVEMQMPDHPSTELRALDQLVAIAGQFTSNGVDTSLAAFVDYLDALSQMGSSEGVISTAPDEGSVALMTIHGAKGLEFDVVVLAGMNRNDAGSRSDSVAKLFPAQLRHDRDIYPDRHDFEDRDAFLDAVKDVEKRLSDEEERRLYYVAVTRARTHLYLTWAETHPSRTTRVKRFPLIDEIESLLVPTQIPAYPALIDEPPLRTFFSTNSTRLNPADNFSSFVSNWSAWWRGSQAEEEAMTALDDGLARFAAGKQERASQVEQVRRTLADSTFAPLTRNVFSYSQISCYEACPRRYQLQYVLGVPQNPANDWQTQLGSAFHDALHDLHLARQGGTDRNFADLVKRAFGDAQAEFESDATRLAIDGFLQSTDAQAEPIATEQEFYLRLGSGRGAPVIYGLIDRIQKTQDGEIEIVDYKTNRHNKSRAEVLADMQLPIYVLACREAVGLDPKYATMAFVRHNNWVRLNISEIDLTGARLRIDSAIRGIASHQFKCTCGGTQCSI